MQYIFWKGEQNNAASFGEYFYPTTMNTLSWLVGFVVLSLSFSTSWITGFIRSGVQRSRTQFNYKFNYPSGSSQFINLLPQSKNCRTPLDVERGILDHLHYKHDQFNIPCIDRWSPIVTKDLKMQTFHIRFEPYKYKTPFNREIRASDDDKVVKTEDPSRMSKDICKEPLEESGKKFYCQTGNEVNFIALRKLVVIKGDIFSFLPNHILVNHAICKEDNLDKVLEFIIKNSDMFPGCKLIDNNNPCVPFIKITKIMENRDNTNKSPFAKHGHTYFQLGVDKESKECRSTYEKRSYANNDSQSHASITILLTDIQKARKALNLRR